MARVNSVPFSHTRTSSCPWLAGAYRESVLPRMFRFDTVSFLIVVNATFGNVQEGSRCEPRPAMPYFCRSLSGRSAM
jgi:hypothetical protein